MKKLKTTALVLTILFYAASCKTHDNSPSTLMQIQNKWIIDSAILYDNAQMSGPGYKVEALTGYSDFRSDNRSYEFSSARVGGIMETSYDTSSYSLTSDNKQMISVPLVNGRPTSSSDTFNIMLLTDKNLVFSQISLSGAGANGKIYYHR